MNLSSVSISQFESKVKSKKELHRFLVHDCQAYLPPIQSTNVYFIKAIMRGTKDVQAIISGYIKRDKVFIAAVPQIEGLTVEDILAYAKGSQVILNHLPEERDWVHTDRKWICDVVYSLDKVNFQKFIDDAVLSRKQRLETSRNMLVDMRPEFALALQSCLNFSMSHGRAANLVKASSKRKRTREELEEVKEEEDMLKGDRHEFLRQFKRLREEKALMESDLYVLQASRDTLQRHSQSTSADQSKSQFII